MPLSPREEKLIAALRRCVQTQSEHQLSLALEDAETLLKAIDREIAPEKPAYLTLAWAEDARGREGWHIISHFANGKEVEDPSFWLAKDAAQTAAANRARLLGCEFRQ